MATSYSDSTTLSHLQQLFPDVLLLNSRQTASVLNIPYKTLTNAGDDFPIRFVKFGPKKFFRVIDIAHHVDALLGITNPPVDSVVVAPEVVAASLPAKRGRGRPRKVVGRVV